MTDMQTLLAGMVRRLEWHEQTRAKGYVTGQWWALGFGGAYLITIYTTENDGCSLHLGHFDRDGQSHHPNLEAAKQAAYDDTCRRAAIALNPDAVLSLQDPVAVHANMLRGTIAKPSWANILHLYPTESAALVAAAYADALVAIADIPTPATEDQARGHEDAYRAVKARAMKGEGA